MARLRVADGGHKNQIWRVAAKILTKQSWAAQNGWPSKLGVSRGAIAPYCKKSACNESSHRVSELEGFIGTT